MDGVIGTIMLFAGNFVPTGWMLCDGRVLAISEHQALFSILGTRYGGDGRTNFRLPALAPLPVVAPSGSDPVSFYICAVGLYPKRD